MQTQTITEGQINNLFDESISKDAFSLIIDGDEQFTKHDLDIILTVGPTGWATSQNLNLSTESVDWENLPDVLRQAIISDVLEPMDWSFRYAVSIRRVGRVFVFAILPDLDIDIQRPIVLERAMRSEPISIPSTQTQRRQPKRIIDPPIPFPLLGSATPEILTRQANAVRLFLRQTGNTQTFRKRIMNLVIRLTDHGAITKSEMFYYITGMRALASGSWRQLREYFSLLALDQLIAQQDKDSLISPQQIVYEHLILGRPIEVRDGGNILRLEARD